MSSLDAVRARFARNEGLPFVDILTEANIRDVLNEHGVQYRDRVFSPVTTIWVFLSQVLSEDHSCRNAVSQIIAHRAANGITVCSPNTASYCNARSRILTSVLSTLQCGLRKSYRRVLSTSGNGMADRCSSSMALMSPCRTPQRIKQCTHSRQIKSRGSVFRSPESRLRYHWRRERVTIWPSRRTKARALAKRLSSDECTIP